MALVFFIRLSFSDQILSHFIEHVFITNPTAICVCQKCLVSHTGENRMMVVLINEYMLALTEP